LTGRVTRENESTSGHRDRIKLLLLFLLLLMMAAEGYYIYHLQDKIARRNDELNNISVQLQHLKTEREDLIIELSREKTEETLTNGNTAER